MICLYDTYFPFLAESFDEDLEVKRASKVHDIQKDIWIDDNFKDKK